MRYELPIGPGRGRSAPGSSRATHGAERWQLDNVSVLGVSATLQYSFDDVFTACKVMCQLLAKGER